MQPPRRLRIYPEALRLLVLLDELAAALPSVRAYIADQLHRAALSIVLNLEEGAHEFSPREKTRFYRMSYRSLAECRALVDVIEALRLDPGARIPEARRVLERLSPRIHNLIRRRPPAPPGSGDNAPS